MANPFASFFGTPAPAPRPAANPFAPLFTAAPPDGDEWQRIGHLLVNRRTGETKPAPTPEGQLPTTADVPREAKPLDFLRRAGAAALSNLSGPSDLVEMAMGPALDAFNPAGLLGVHAPKPLVSAISHAVTEPTRMALRGAEAVTGLPFTSASQQRERERYRGLEQLDAHGKPVSPIAEALTDTIAEGVGNFIDPAAFTVAAASKLGKLARPAESALHFVTTAGEDGLLTIAARRAGKEAGWVRVAPEAGGGVVHMVEVAPELRRQGIATALYDEAARVVGGPLSARGHTPEGVALRSALEARRPDLVGAAAPPASPFDELARTSLGIGHEPPAATRGPALFDAPTSGQPAHAPKLGPADGLPFEFNAARYDLPKDQADTLLQAIKDDLPAIQDQRRGVQGWEKWKGTGLEQLRAQLGITEEKLLKTRPGKAMNDDELAVLGGVVGSKAQRIKQLADGIASGAAPESARAEVAKLMLERQALLRVAVGAHSEAGRSLNSLKAWQRALAAPDQVRIALMKRFGETITPEMTDQLAALDTHEDVVAFLRKVDKPTLKNLTREAWVASVLSGVPTQERNAIGNAVMAAGELAIRPVRGAMDFLRAKVAGGQRAAFAGETVPAAIGLGHGLRKGLAKGIMVFRKGYDPATPLDELAGKFGNLSGFAMHESPLVRKIGGALTVPLRLLNSVDALFSTANFTSEQYALAARMGLKRGLKGEELATHIAENLEHPSVLQGAGDFARRATFRDEPSAFASNIMKARDSVPGGFFVAPFVRILDRQMVRGFEYTPVGVVRGLGALRAGDHLAASDLLAKGVVGSAAMYGLASLAEDGGLTAWAPRDPIEKQKFYAAGKQPWSLKIGDTWYPYGQLEPFATPVALVASMKQAHEETAHLPAADQLVKIAMAMGARTLDASYMQGLQNLLEATAGDESGMQKAQTLVAGIAGGAVPFSALLRGIETAEDPRYLKPDTIIEKMMANLPGGREELPSEPDRWGQPQMLTGGSARAYAASGTPMLATQEKVDPVEQRLDALGVDVGFASRTIDGLRLSDDDYRKWQTVAGQAQRGAIERLMAKPGFNDAPEEQQRRALEAARDAAKERAGAAFRRDNKELFSGYRRARRIAADFAETARTLRVGKREGSAAVRDARGGDIASILAAKKQARSSQEQRMADAAQQLEAARAKLVEEGYSETESRDWLIKALMDNGLSRKDAIATVAGAGR